MVGYYVRTMTHTADILIAGAGSAGLSAALALAQGGYRVAIAGPADTSAGTRSLALFEGSMRFFGALGLRNTIEETGAQILSMQIADDTGSRFAGPPISFDPRDIGLDAFGTNIENHLLALLLEKAVAASSAIRHFPELITAYSLSDDRVEATLAGGEKITAKLLVAADGAGSRARKAARIGAQTWDYRQMAMTATLAHDFSHNNISTELHTRQGPFTLVPLPGDDVEPHRSALVWLMTPPEAKRRAALSRDELAIEMEKFAHYRLGEMELLRPVNVYAIRGLAARHVFGHRIALVGEAAHVFPPIGAQGLNLGLRDVAHLAEVLDHADDPGDPELLKRYAARRGPDIGSRSVGVDVLNRALLNTSLASDFVRGAGVGLLRTLGPLRLRLMAEGILPGFGAPHVMRSSQRAVRTRSRHRSQRKPARV